MRKYTVIPHTADAGITAYGRTLQELFAHAAEGMIALLDADAPPAPAVTQTVEVDGYDNETLLINWLNELLYLFAVQRFYPSEIHIHTLEKGMLRAVVAGRTLPPQANVRREIKAATYHALALRTTKNGFEVTIIFDV